MPSHGSKLFLHLYISFFVSVDFMCPKICIGFWWNEVFALMSMPKTTIDEDARSIFSQHQVGMSWQSGAIEPITKATRMKVSADNHLRFRILAMDRSHDFATLFFSNASHSLLFGAKIHI
jgi:hypothetical protein